MNCNELRDHYDLYAIGVAEEPERGEIHEHLKRECEVCMEGMRKAREVSAMLGTSAPGAAPSAKLRRRILASIGAEQRGFGWVPALAGLLAMALFACVYFVGRANDVKTELARTTERLRQENIELARLNEVFSIVNGADTTVTSFGDGQSQPPKGKVFVSPTRGMVLVASNLPPAPAGKRYEMWVIPKAKGGKPLPAGLFQSESDGTATHVLRGKVDGDAGLVAVTLEDEAGSDHPTSAPLFAAAIRGLVP